MQRLDFGLTRSGINQCIVEIVSQSERPNPFNENGPGQKWWQRFMKDYPELSFYIPQALNEACAQKENPIIINNHFDKLKKIIQEYSLTPNKIWNMDETGFVIELRLQKVMTKKSAHQVHRVSYKNSHEYISICPMISTAGTYILLLIIYKEKRMIPDLLNGTPAGSVM
ncbi:5534_t:CDS:2 [Acaulospora colombiana]|uniref:5534_t:CDS:1 n=1 Tax=Acaulospora colombiana TaxID=27376 RepID=A0ACA9K8S9_9GLOM|nr:5534_t:CDS:2 [Acaulospora colombiana]